MAGLGDVSCADPPLKFVRTSAASKLKVKMSTGKCCLELSGVGAELAGVGISGAQL
ncbi:hypothetical protein PF005_g15315 [Phytophthora fragariae]|uniref:Uncharacterized protein n=2 Tax=Phytophthora TaxID=4783 RepID=A0A6A3YFZ1_9STRA|nr:hypothetical protein PF003_g32819 [Phytophthora fragariae]KAE9045675.1 hypothetical protein PR002_g2087 [Phytophthora rubi]KAE8933385.1 hypothetical protein PF009_g16607 [Phytophthora fragariae]KAE9000037.1 hypothetical protein PF011_g14363 [Phytophthora fragariae]KAE9099925.1 hypothetical protein PF007_g15701 [Phytophthora fragariae]